MTFNMDFSNDKPDLREPIPAGTVLYVEMTYKPGGADLAGTAPEQREGALTKAKEPSDAYYLMAEFTVLRGPYKGRKFWSNLTVSGGKVDEKGRSIAAGITRQTIRCILDSSQGLKASDESPDAMAKRVIRGYRDLQKRRFIAKVKVEPPQNGYPAKNGLGQVLTVDMKGYPATEAELDAPVAAGAAKDAPAAPVWGAATPAAAPSPEVTAPVVAFTQPAAAAAVVERPVAPVQPAAQQDNSGIPLWAQPSQKAA